MSEVVIRPPQIPNMIIKHIKWHTSLNQYINIGQDLCTITCDILDDSSSLLFQILESPIYKTKTFKLKSTGSGIVAMLASHEEALNSNILCIIENKTSLQTIQNCKHEIEFGGMCAFCGYRANE